MRPRFFYQIEFADGRVIRREYQTKSMAEAIYKSLEAEMLLFNIKLVQYGEMR
jgi:hypothetical protein